MHKFCACFQNYQNETFFLLSLQKSYCSSLYMGRYKISFHLFWIQNGLWWIIGCWYFNNNFIDFWKSWQSICFYTQNFSRFINKTSVFNIITELHIYLSGVISQLELFNIGNSKCMGGTYTPLLFNPHRITLPDSLLIERVTEWQA